MAFGLTNAALGTKYGHYWLPWRGFNGIPGAAGVDASLANGVPVAAALAGAATLTGLQIAAVNDAISHFAPLLAFPWSDWTKDLQASIVFIHSSTDADTPVWTFRHRFHAVQSAIAGVDIGGTFDKSIAFVAHTCSTTNESIEQTAWTSLNTIADYVATDKFWAFCVEVTNIGGAAANEIEFMGVLFRYTLDIVTGEAQQAT